MTTQMDVGELKHRKAAQQTLRRPSTSFTKNTP